MNIDNQTLQNNKDFKGTLNNTLKGALSYGAPSGENQYSDEGQVLGSFKDEITKILNDGLSASDEINIKDILDDMDIIEVQNLECVNIEKNDAIFYINLLNQNGIVNYTVSNDGSVIDGFNYKNIEVSKTLSNLLLKASETKKAVRLDFDNNVTVILKLNDGKIDARFLPGDKIAEEYLKNNIPYLKQRFDENNIPYANISYKQQRQRENGQNNKEKK